jgi:tripartite-type tricarboxylate transporter receptor subunit TctC
MSRREMQHETRADVERQNRRGRTVENAMLSRIALMLMAWGLTFPAAAQDWPFRSVRIIVPFAAGSTPDIVTRLVADRLQRRLAQPFVVENKPGASGNIGTDAVAKAEGDGYTIGISIGGPLAINPFLFGKLPYDPAKDFAYVTLMATQPNVLAVHASLNVASVPQLVAHLKANPGKLNYGSIGNGSLSHLCMEAIMLASGSKLVHIPYASSPQAMTALLRGDVHVVCLPALGVTPHAANPNARILAITTARRSALVPGVPTLKESGIDVEADAWNGIIAPANTPPAIITRLHDEIAAVLVLPEIREKLTTQVMEPIPSTPAEFRARIEADIARWVPVIKAANIKVN